MKGSKDIRQSKQKKSDISSSIPEYPPSRYIEERPWGGFEKYVENQACSVKVLTVRAGQRLSLQSHRFRSEWWIVLDESMDVELDGESVTLIRGQDIYIPLGAKHRVIGRETDCRWLEIAFGQFDEDDIVRYEDSYGRSKSAQEATD